MTLQARIDFSGPFFTRDPRKTVRQNIRDLMDRIAEEGERDVKAQVAGLQSQMPAWTGWTHRRVRGRTESLSGRRWALTAVVSANTAGMDKPNAIRTKAAAASIERRWHPFRRTASALRKSRAALAADLTRGLE